MSKGTFPLIGFLAIIFIFLIIIFTIVLWLTKLLPGQNIIELFWINIFKTLNTGTITGDNTGQINFLVDATKGNFAQSY